VTLPGGVVLAAGAGTRFGMPKALVSLGGELLVDRALRTLDAGGCCPVVVVIGAQADDVVRAARLSDAVVVENAEWQSGLASSLRCGLDALRETEAGAAVIALADQPGMTSGAVRRLISAWEGGARGAVASYDGSRRNPVLLDRTVWDAAIRDATGDVGARAWMSKNPDEVVDVPCEDIACPDDIDRPPDLEAFLAADR
jgi:nicotine blue oxidoreductase